MTAERAHRSTALKAVADEFASIGANHKVDLARFRPCKTCDVAITRRDRPPCLPIRRSSSATSRSGMPVAVTRSCSRSGMPMAVTRLCSRTGRAGNRQATQTACSILATAIRPGGFGTFVNRLAASGR